jgi:hypothetical protein
MFRVPEHLRAISPHDICFLVHVCHRACTETAVVLVHADMKVNIELARNQIVRLELE